MTQVTVVGARGYMGRELVRLLHAHPDVEAIQATSSTVSDVDQPTLEDAVPAFAGTGQKLRATKDAIKQPGDVAFLAVPSKQAGTLVEQLHDAGCKHIIDLSRDHRSKAIQQDAWHYGMADLNPPAQGTKRIANPGCYPTAAALALHPAKTHDLLGGGPIIVDGKSGLSGAGITPDPMLHFAEANERVTAYKVMGHDHEREMAEWNGQTVAFTPHLIPQTRGLLATVYAPAKPGTTAADVATAYEATYANNTFVHAGLEPSTAAVKGSNNAQVQASLDANGLLRIRCAIDNLMKGGSGQAVQNMNHALGLPAERGLPTVGML